MAISPAITTRDPLPALDSPASALSRPPGATAAPASRATATHPANLDQAQRLANYRRLWARAARRRHPAGHLGDLIACAIVGFTSLLGLGLLLVVLTLMVAQMSRSPEAAAIVAISGAVLACVLAWHIARAAWRTGVLARVEAAALSGTCPRCDYDLSAQRHEASMLVCCPECGEISPTSDAAAHILGKNEGLAERGGPS